MNISALFTPFQLGTHTLKNRFVLPPMTRCRSSQPGNIPNDMMATYYEQRTSAPLIISEATQISNQGQGYSFTPGIFTEDQIDGWKKITGAVHRKGSVIFNQLWHVGRMSHPMFHDGHLPVAPSAIAPGARVWVSENGQGTMVDCPVPRALEHDEIAEIVQDYALAARNAITAGFDGVEIHAANGYLIDQFIRSTSNVRTDEYGGSIENRLRFLREVVQAVVDAIGAERVGIRMAPFNKTRGMDCPEILQTITEAAKWLNSHGILYFHIAEADWDDAPKIPETFRRTLRELFGGAIIGTGAYTPEKGEQLIQQGLIDLAGFGRPFIANPDYPKNVRTGDPLREFDRDALFGGSDKGYIDY